MTILNRIREFFRRGPSARYGLDDDATFYPERLIQRINTNTTWPDFDLGSAELAYAKSSLIFRCLNLIAHAIGTAPLRTYDESDDDNEVPDHPMRKLLRRPNATMGEAMFYGAIALRAGVAGFCVIEKERSVGGNVIALNLLNSCWLKAIPIGRNQYDWEYRVPKQNVQRLKAADVAVYRWADSPSGSPYGVPPMATLVKDVRILEALTDFVGNLLERGGVPQWVFFEEGTALVGGYPGDDSTSDEQDRRAWEADWLSQRGGIRRRDIPYKVSGIQRVQKLSYDPNELAMAALRDLSDLDICQAFGVPARKAQTRVGLEHVTENTTAQIEDTGFYHDTILPLWTRLDDAFTTSLLPDFEEDPESPIYLQFDTSKVPAFQEDRNEKATWVIAGFEKGMIDRDLAYNELGLQIPKTPNYRLQPINVEVVSLAAPKPQLAATTTPMLILAAGRGPAERYVKIGERNRTAILKIAESRAPSFAAFLAGQKARVLTALRSPVGVAQSRYAVDDLDWEEEHRRLGQPHRQLMLMNGETAFAAAATDLGLSLSFDLANPNIKQTLDQLAPRVVGINQTTRDDIAAQITAGLQAGETLEQLAARIEGLFDSTYSGRAMTISRTESQISFNTASVLAYKASNVVKRAVLLDNIEHGDHYGAADGLSCAERNGLEVELDAVALHINSEHPNGTLAVAPILASASLARSSNGHDKTMAALVHPGKDEA